MYCNKIANSTQPRNSMLLVIPFRSAIALCSAKVLNNCLGKGLSIFLSQNPQGLGFSRSNPMLLPDFYIQLIKSSSNWEKEVKPVIIPVAICWQS